jgi:hypothetical protein
VNLVFVVRWDVLVRWDHQGLEVPGGGEDPEEYQEPLHLLVPVRWGSPSPWWLSISGHQWIVTL